VCPVDAASGRSVARLGGTLPILAATVVAGVGAYLISLIAPAVLRIEEYAAFAVFWSVTYFVTASLAAVQNEVSRATIEAPPESPGPGPMLRAFTLWTLAAAVVAGALVMAFAGPALFGGAVPALIWPFLLAIAGYVLAATIGGVLSGLRLWGLVGLAILVDAVLRVVLVVPALLLGTDAATIAWLVAAPFVLGPVVTWLVARRRIVARIRFDVPTRMLVGNIASTLPGAASAALLGTGLPALVGLAPGATAASIAPLIFAATILRSPIATVAISLQAFLIVRFRGGADRRRTVAVLGVLGLGVVVLAVLAWLLGPWAVETVFSPALVVTGQVYGLVVVSGGLVAGLYVTGAALLAAARHWWQSLGWVAAALVTVAVLLPPWPMPLDPRLVAALLAGPIVGLAIHGVGLARWHARRTVVDADR